MGYLRKYVKKYYKLFILAVFFLSVEAAGDLLQPMMMARIVDIGIRNRDLHAVLRMGAVMLGVAGVGAVGAVGRNILSSRVSQRFGSDLRFDLFAKIQRLPYGEAERFDPASLVTRLLNDVTQLQNFVNGMMRIFVKSPLLCVGSIALAVAMEPRLSLIILFVVPVIAAVVVLNNRVGFPYFRRVQRGVDRLGGVMREYLSGVRVVKAFNHATFEEERFEAANAGLMGAQTAAMRVSALFSPATATAMNFGIAAVLWFGSFAVNAGDVQVGRIIAFINYMTQMSGSFVMLSSVFTLFVRARASAERIGEVMRAESEPQAEPEPSSGTENGAEFRAPEAVRQPAAEAETGAAARAPTPAVPQPEPVRAPGLPYPNLARALPALPVEFRGVGFSYGGGAEALRDVSFAVSPGETLGVIGTTGAGKTTLVSLIPRFYDAAAGQVLVGGRDVREWDVHALRARIAVVAQKNVLFTGSILENIRWGDPRASLAQARRAAELAQIGDFIDSRPEGFGTLLGQGGVNLSGGQKQRLALARALVKSPDILLLDDCTSAVDAITEQKIREGLRQYAGGTLCITIAQRIASVMGADRILVLDDGRVCGYGAHRGLLESCRVYRELYVSQFGKEGL